jgi:hypothetical protein
MMQHQILMIRCAIRLRALDRQRPQPNTREVIALPMRSLATTFRQKRHFNDGEFFYAGEWMTPKSKREVCPPPATIT